MYVTWNTFFREFTYIDWVCIIDSVYMKISIYVLRELTLYEITGYILSIDYSPSIPLFDHHVPVC